MATSPNLKLDGGLVQAIDGDQQMEKTEMVGEDHNEEEQLLGYDVSDVFTKQSQRCTCQGSQGTPSTAANEPGDKYICHVCIVKTRANFEKQDESRWSESEDEGPGKSLFVLAEVDTDGSRIAIPRQEPLSSFCSPTSNASSFSIVDSSNGVTSSSFFEFIRWAIH